MTARFRWLRELWGARVTLRTWLGGCLVVMLALIPHWLVTALLFCWMPDVPGRQAVIFFGAGVLAVALFAAGGGVLLLRLLGVARAAPPALAQMVEKLAQEMKLPGRVKVLELEWAQVNAVAWVIHRTVGFSRPLLEVMREDEVRAVAAHELAHLIEPRGIRMVRVAHMFAYLPAVPVIKYGGAAGLLAGYLGIVGVALAYKRFTRRLEQRADRLEHEAIGDREVYMRSMVALHRANVVPAVVPGTQTHPHLYDRLLAAGVQPEFPKPMAPGRGKPMWLMLATALVTLAALVFILVAVGVALRLRARWA
jgi:Zn-dependent protease with chaperone function